MSGDSVSGVGEEYLRKYINPAIGNQENCAVEAATANDLSHF
jgi:hypothetical protein